MPSSSGYLGLFSVNEQQKFLYEKNHPTCNYVKTRRINKNKNGG
jgi:hypothetical protein